MKLKIESLKLEYLQSEYCLILFINVQTNTKAKLRSFYHSKCDSLHFCKWLLLFSHFAVRAVEVDELSFSSWTQIPENITGGGKL